MPNRAARASHRPARPDGSPWGKRSGRDRRSWFPVSICWRTAFRSVSRTSGSGPGVGSAVGLAGFSLLCCGPSDGTAGSGAGIGRNAENRRSPQPDRTRRRRRCRVGPAGRGPAGRRSAGRCPAGRRPAGRRPADRRRSLPDHPGRPVSPSPSPGTSAIPGPSDRISGSPSSRPSPGNNTRGIQPHLRPDCIGRGSGGRPRSIVEIRRRTARFDRRKRCPSVGAPGAPDSRLPGVPVYRK